MISATTAPLHRVKENHHVPKQQQQLGSRASRKKCAWCRYLQGMLLASHWLPPPRSYNAPLLPSESSLLHMWVEKQHLLSWAPPTSRRDLGYQPQSDACPYTSLKSGWVRPTNHMGLQRKRHCLPWYLPGFLWLCVR